MCDVSSYIAYYSAFYIVNFGDFLVINVRRS